MQITKECNLAQTVVDLLDGKTIVFPTETSYGLGCDATNQTAVDRVFAIKGRKSGKPLLVVVPNVEMAKKILVWNDTLEKLAQKYWPGPLTVVGEYKESEPALARGVVVNDKTVAVRVTAHPLLVSITEKINRPLVATSANLADRGDIYSFEKIVDQFGHRSRQPDVLMDYGVLPKHKPTTIVKVLESGFEVVRSGEITVTL